MTKKRILARCATTHQRKLAEFYLENTASNYTLLEAYKRNHTFYVKAKILVEGNTYSMEKHAVEQNDIHLLEFLKNYTSQSFTEFYNGSSLLHIAIALNKPVEIVERLISFGTRLDATDSDGKTALLVAASTANINALEYLMSLDANLTITDNSGHTMLHYLLIDYDVGYVENFLRSYSFDLELLTKVLSSFIYPSPNAIILAEHIMNLAKSSASFPVENLQLAELYSGIYDLEFDNSRKTALHTAVEDANFFDVQMFLQYSPNQTKLLNQGFSPFHLAAMNPNQNLIELFPITEIDHKTSRGQTALHLAVTADNNNVVDWLLFNKANINALDLNKESPIFLAAKLGLNSLIEKLVYHGADLELRNVFGQSISSFMTVEYLEEMRETSKNCKSLECSGNQICGKLDDFYFCECKPGYYSEQGICEDMDECLVNSCPGNSVCENTLGSFFCRCEVGYLKTSDGSCGNFDECITSPCVDENSFCVDNSVVKILILSNFRSHELFAFYIFLPP